MGCPTWAFLGYTRATVGFEDYRLHAGFPLGSHMGPNGLAHTGAHTGPVTGPVAKMIKVPGGQPKWAPHGCPYFTHMGPTWVCWLGKRSICLNMRKNEKLLLLQISHHQIKSGQSPFDREFNI
jgi:hypothetical protein